MSSRVVLKPEGVVTKCQKREVNLTSLSRDIVPQSLGFTCNCKGSMVLKPPYFRTVFSTLAPLPKELARSCGLKLGRYVPSTEF